MEVQYGAGAGTLVQVVDVLRDDARIGISLLQTGYGFVRRIGLGIQYVTTAGIIEIDAQLRVAQPRIVRAHILDAVLLPQSVSIAERAQTALGGYSGTGKNNNFLHGYMCYRVSNFYSLAERIYYPHEEQPFGRSGLSGSLTVAGG